jgi:hypothetical protein
MNKDGMVSIMLSVWGFEGIPTNSDDMPCGGGYLLFFSAALRACLLHLF